MKMGRAGWAFVINETIVILYLLIHLWVINMSIVELTYGRKGSFTNPEQNLTGPKRI